MKKYPRTYHFQFSPEVHDDDKVIHLKYTGNFLKNEMIITEKLDGGNCGIQAFKGVVARSVNEQTTCPTFDYIKNVHYYSKLHLMNEDYRYCGENMFGIHSLEYENLDDYFYLFNIFDTKMDKVLSWDEIERESKKLDFKLAPVVYRGKIDSLGWLSNWMHKQILKGSRLGGDCEGFVVRPADEFPLSEFDLRVAKYVRKGHVQSDEHWSKNWKQAKLKDQK